MTAPRGPPATPGTPDRLVLSLQRLHNRIAAPAGDGEIGVEQRLRKVQKLNFASITSAASSAWLVILNSPPFGNFAKREFIVRMGGHGISANASAPTSRPPTSREKAQQTLLLRFSEGTGRYRFTPTGKNGLRSLPIRFFGD
jgi:hypothetical protein